MPEVGEKIKKKITNILKFTVIGIISMDDV